MAAGPGCPQVSLLEKLALGLLSDQEAETVESHVEQCARCGQTLDTLPLEDDLTDLIREQSASGGAGAGDVEGLIRRLKGLVSDSGPATESRLTTPPQEPASRAADTADPGAGPLPDTAEEVRRFLAGPEHPGEIGRLGPYAVWKLLGAGGMGVVFEAEDPQLRRRVALKVIRPGLAGSVSARERFLREARAMAALEHDHVVTVFQVGEDRGVLFLAMPLLRGEPLETRLQREGKLPIAEVLRIGRETAEGLAAAHERGLIHRDIKPGNLWLEARGPESGGRPLTPERVKILDFGLALAVDDPGHLTGTGAIAGTPHYMAPELLDGAPADARTDLFSLGGVLYRMATGELPFKGSTPLQVVRSLAREQPRPPCEINPEVPAELSDLIVQLLAKDPTRRPASPGAVVEALDRIRGRAGRPASGTTEISRISIERILGTSTGRRLAAAAALFVVLALTLYAVGPAFYRSAIDWDTAGRDGASGAGAGPAPLVIGEVTAPVPAGEIRVFHGHQAEVGPVACSADGSRALSGSFDGTVMLWDLESGKDLDKFAGAHMGWAGSVAFSPDGRQALSAGSRSRSSKPVRLWDLERNQELRYLPGQMQGFLHVAFVSAGPRALAVGGTDANTLHLWDVDGRRELCRFVGHTDRVRCAVLSADGRQVLSGSTDQTARLWDAATGAMLRKFEGHSGAVLAVALAPDGSGVLSGGEDGTVRLWAADAGKELRCLKGHEGSVEAVAFSPDGKWALSGGHDGILRLWDLEDGRELCRLEGHAGVIGGVAFTPDGRRALSAGSDRTVRLWRLPTEQRVP